MQTGRNFQEQDKNYNLAFFIIYRKDPSTVQKKDNTNKSSQSIVDVHKTKRNISKVLNTSSWPWNLHIWLTGLQSENITFDKLENNKSLYNSSRE